MKHREVLLGYAIFLWVLSVTFLAGPDIYPYGKAQVMNLAGNVVGVNATIPPNEFNTLLAQISQKEKELNERTQALAAREQSILAELDSIQRNREERIYQYLFGFTALLLLLVFLNYYLDFKRTSQVG